MLYINIDQSIKEKQSIYSVNYIDCPSFTFIKRISKVRIIKGLYYEMGLDFSDTPYFYRQKYLLNEAPFDLKMGDICDFLLDSKKLLLEFKNKNIISRMKTNMDSPVEGEILDRLFKEINEKVNKIT